MEYINKTEIRERKGWKKLAEFKGMLPLQNGDYFEHEGIEYHVESKGVETGSDVLTIIVE